MKQRISKTWLRNHLAAIAIAHGLAIALLPGFSVSIAQQLPIRSYTVADGLPATWVGEVFQDSKGYMWFVSGMTASRFDGYRFTNYDARDELGESVYFSSMAEDRKGRLWFTTFGWAGALGNGVARLIDDPAEAASLRSRGLTATPRSNFVVYPIDDSRDSRIASQLLFDANDTLWCITDAGLYRAAASPTDNLKFEMVVPGGKVAFHSAAFGDSRGRLWFGLRNVLVEVTSDRVLKYQLPDAIGTFEINALAEDSHGRLVAVNRTKLFEFIEPSDPSQAGSWNTLPISLAPKQDLSALAFDTTDTLWIGTDRGLIKYSQGSQIVYTTAQGLNSNGVASLRLDREGNLWLGNKGGGVSKFSGEMIVSYAEADGLPDRWTSVFKDRQGRIYATTGSAGTTDIRNEKAVLIPGSEVHSYSGTELIVQDRLGDWWIGTMTGLFHSKGPKLQFRRGRKLTEADGIPEAEVRTVHEDSSGQIWVSMAEDYLYLFEPGREGHRSQAETLKAGGFTTGITKLFDDDGGPMWLISHSMLGRLISGKVTVFEPTEGLPEVRARGFFKDSRGWLWIGLRNRGVSITRNPNDEHPTFVNYTTKNGLSNDTVWTIVEDDSGRIYLGTDNGIDQFDVGTGQIRHISSRDGLAGDYVSRLIKDTNGNIWAGTNAGISRYNPLLERNNGQPPPTYLDRIAAGGEEIPLARGATHSQLTLGPSQNSLRIEFVGLSFYGQASLKYQFKLEGVDDDWSAPSEERSVNYARLASGSYRFLARAINRDGLSTAEPALIQFRVLPPIWQRWWFVTLALIVLAAGVYALYRYRVARLLEVERVRLRIASDLHDEMGSGLGSIGILSGLAAEDHLDEVERKQLARKIAVTSGELGTALGEIVWTLRPGSATLESLVYHLSERAGRLFPGPSPLFTTDFPAVWPRITLSLEVRRNLMLIALEALHNSARHARANRVVLGISPVGRKWQLWIADDGIGLSGGETNGHPGLGLTSMRRRANEIGATISWTQNGDAGTTVTILFDPCAPEGKI